MSHFQHAIEVVLKHEGGFVDDPVDPGGATNFGISLRWLVTQGDLGDLDNDGDVDADDIAQMTRDQAKGIYKARWWDKHDYGAIKGKTIATKLFDLTVNMGAKQNHKLIQRALCCSDRMVAVDGILGQNTRSAINSAEQHMLLGAYRAEAWAFYRHLIYIKPKFAKYENGWTKRALA